MAPSLSSPISPPEQEYDVFLSFSGLDSRKNIISHLQAALKRNNFRTFKDDKNLDRGKDIATGLFEAIENSSMSIIVFSKNYFASKWCLAELEKIMEYSKNLHHIVIPIFVDIEPSDIRNLKGSIAETLAKHEEEVPNTENWRATLTEVASLAGFVSNSDTDEASLVEDIVKDVEGKLNSGIQLNVAKHPVGIEPRLQKLLKELCLESSDDVRIIAIWGVGGLGKTTIAKAAYNYIHSRFEGCSFVDNVREKWEQSNKGLLALQNQIRSDILKNKSSKIRNSHKGVEFLKHRAFYGRKVLLVLDDVDHVKQLNALAIDPRFLYRGSRIIVTTRDISSLNSLTKYELELLNEDESLRLFSLHAFNQHNPPEGFMELSNTVVDYAEGIPLVLEVWGCFLNGNNNQSEWRSAIAKMKKIPHDDVQRKVQQVLDKVKFLDLSYCENLTTTPNLFGLPSLEKLNLDDCVRLQEVDKSIGHLSYYTIDDDTTDDDDVSYHTTDNDTIDDDDVSYHTTDDDTFDDDDVRYHTTDDDTIDDDDVNYYTIDDDTFMMSVICYKQ